MLLFQLLWVLDALILFIAASGFILYLFRQQPTAAITGTWLLLLGVFSTILFGAVVLKTFGQFTSAMLLLTVMAMPAAIFLLLIMKRLFTFLNRFTA